MICDCLPLYSRATRQTQHHDSMHLTRICSFVELFSLSRHELSMGVAFWRLEAIWVQQSMLCGMFTHVQQHANMKANTLILLESTLCIRLSAYIYACRLRLSCTYGFSSSMCQTPVHIFPALNIEESQFGAKLACMLCCDVEVSHTRLP